MDPDDTLPVAPPTMPAPPPSDMDDDGVIIPLNARDPRFMAWADAMLRADDDFDGFAVHLYRIPD